MDLAVRTISQNTAILSRIEGLLRMNSKTTGEVMAAKFEDTICFSCHYSGNSPHTPSPLDLKKLVADKGDCSGEEVLKYKVRNGEYPDCYLSENKSKEISGIMPIYDKEQLSDIKL